MNGGTPPPRVLLVGNYSADGQESMLRFAGLLAGGLPAHGVEVHLLAPAPLLNKRRAAYSGAGKWLAYADKYLLFPHKLRQAVRRLGPGAIVHVCDHSNAVYAPVARRAGARVVVTCHDLGAVRGARGEDTDCPASATGKVLQNWIARSLGGADYIACVSAATARDVARIVRAPDGGPAPAGVVPLGLNAPYGVLEPAESAARLTEAAKGLDRSQPFVLNVGSSLRRKNREGVLRTFALIADRFPGQLVFAGEALPEELSRLAGELGIASRTVQVVGPSNAALEALYNRALALLFPSRFEGFGWPVIEAQACGCPVLCGNGGSLAEVGGEGAFVRPADDEAAFAEELLRLAGDGSARAVRREQGFVNLKRFRAETMLESYARIYRELAAGRRATLS